MKKAACLLLPLFLLCIKYCEAQQGRDGAKIVSGANTIFNEYTSLTANASAGNTSFSVTGSSLNSHNRFAASLSKGDLVVIIQMQGASINGTSADSTWGAITNYNNCGLYEFLEVDSVPNGTSINFNSPLKNNYTATGKVQVVRVPRLSSLTIDSGGILTCDAWNGVLGGIVALEVQGNTSIDTNGSINATGLGFRGGAFINQTSGPPYTYAFVSTAISQGAAKGESIAGFNADYNAYGGMYCMGAPANGGGGGDAWNSPGGGGANAGNINNYTGDGNPDTTTDSNWITAWNLEYNGFAHSTSSGGGRGGYGVAFSGANPLQVGPNAPIWDNFVHEFNRANNGGKGGRPLDYSTGRIFFGGGGGAPMGDDHEGSSGGNGGGIVYLISYGTISGSGSILSNGNTALNVVVPVSNDADPPGGGGGGGTVILNSCLITGISVYANGGNGGSQIDWANPNGESEGPGGGGGGGYIAISNGNIFRQAIGGANGVTTSVPMDSFPPDGATKGGAGIANAVAPPVSLPPVIASAGSNVIVCDGDTAQLSASGGLTYSWSPATGLSCTNCANPVANPTLSTEYTVTVSVGVCSGSDSVLVSVLPGASPGTITGNPDTICTNDSAQLSVMGSAGSIQWQSSADGITFTDITGDTLTTYTTGALTQTTYYRIRAVAGCGITFSPVQTVSVLPRPVAGVISVLSDTLCNGNDAVLSVMGDTGNIQWQSSADGISFTDIPGATSQVYVAIHPSHSAYFRVEASEACGSGFSQPALINVFPLPFIGAITIDPNPVCQGSFCTLSVTGVTGSVQWQISDTTGNYADIMGADSLSYTTPPLFQTINFRVVANNGICTDTSTPVTLLVNPTPVVPILAATDSIICASDSALITSSGSYSSYLWNNGDTHSYTYATAAGGYWVTVSDADGCTVSSGHINIDVYPVPSVSIIEQGDTLSSYNAVAYQWFFNDIIIPGATSTVYIAHETGNYSVEITDTNGCQTKSNSVYVTVTGVGDISWNGDIKIYPNPSTGDVFIDLPNGKQLFQLKIFNLMGQEVTNQSSQQYASNELEINIRNLPVGLYVFQLIDNQKYTSAPIMKME